MTIWTSLALSLRPMAEQSLNDLAKIEASVRTRAVGGAITKGWAVVVEDVPCRVQPAAQAQTETLTADQLNAPMRWNVSLPLGTPIVEGNRITATGTDFDGNDWTRVLHVVSVDAPRSFEVLRTALCIDPAIGATPEVTSGV